LYNVHLYNAHVVYMMKYIIFSPQSSELWCIRSYNWSRDITRIRWRRYT